MSINLKEHIFSYKTMKKIIYGMSFFKNELRGGKDFFVKANAEILASWNLCVAYRKANSSKHFR